MPETKTVKRMTLPMIPTGHAQISLRIPRIALARPKTLPSTSRWSTGWPSIVQNPSSSQCRGSISAVLTMMGEQSFDVLRDHVDLEVDEVAGCLETKSCELQGRRDEADRERAGPVGHGGDRERDTVHRNRALEGHVADEVGRYGDRDHVPVLGVLTADDAADPVDVALHQVTAEPVQRGHR